MCKAPVKSLPPTNQHPVFFTGRMPFLSPIQQCQSTEGKMSHSMDLLTPSSPGVFQLCLWPLTAPGYLGEGCHASHQPSDASTPTLPHIMLLKLSNCFVERRQTLFHWIFRTSKQPSWLPDMEDHSETWLSYRHLDRWWTETATDLGLVHTWPGHYQHDYWPMVWNLPFPPFVWKVLLSITYS